MLDQTTGPVVALIGTSAATVAAAPETPDLLSIFLICLSGTCAGTLLRYRTWIDKKAGFLRHEFLKDASAIFGVATAGWAAADKFELTIPAAALVSVTLAFLGVDVLRGLLAKVIKAKTGADIDTPDVPTTEAKP
ncbi:MAG: hypothetical protein IT548_02475 [Alphaproteobacteria bacterium]|nr:hypothetical protein [Alphaproteobacteria bacterium]